MKMDVADYFGTLLLINWRTRRHLPEDYSLEVYDSFTTTGYKERTRT